MFVRKAIQSIVSFFWRKQEQEKCSTYQLRLYTPVFKYPFNMIICYYFTSLFYRCDFLLHAGLVTVDQQLKECTSVNITGIASGYQLQIVYQTHRRSVWQLVCCQQKLDTSAINSQNYMYLRTNINQNIILHSKVVMMLYNVILLRHIVKSADIVFTGGPDPPPPSDCLLYTSRCV